MSSHKWRLGLTGVLIILALIAFWDTFRLWTMSDSDRATMQEQDPDKLLGLQQSAIRLGLDLQGGIHVVLRVKSEEVDEAARDGAVDRAIQVIRNRIDGLGVAEPVIQKQGDDRIIVDLPGYTDPERAVELIGQTAVLEFKLLETLDNANLILARIDSVVAAHEARQAGESGAQTPPAPTPESDQPEGITDTAADDILAELLGESARDTMDFGFDESLDIIDEERPFTSKLENSLYNNNTGVYWPAYTVSRDDRQRLERWLSLPEVQRVIPIDVQFAFSTRSEIRNQRQIYELYLLRRKVEFVGRYLENVRFGRDEYGKPKVDFQLSGDGAARFADLTGRSINKPLAIMLDNKVESAPFISSKIRRNGTITMGSSATIENAVNLEIVLKAGSLPAPVEIIEKNVVGATLGADSIRKGFYSSLFGLIIVLLYIAVYYRLSGLIADIGLLFNVFFLLAVMAGLGATLTMPGIAGIILTVGISVDSNILIFERIREELRTGKTVRAAIDAGYERAFVAIFDSHVTTLITAGALFLFGSGPIRGFAVTLFWGVTISLYTAYIITKAIFDIRKGYKTLSI